MNRLDRLASILIQLQTKRWITSHEIAERYGVSQRTVYRDIRTLEEAGVPIGAEAGRGYYLVEGYRLPPVMFTSEEAGALLIAEKLVDKFADISVSQKFRFATDKIKAVLPEKDKVAIDTLNRQVAVFRGEQTGSKDYPNEFITSIEKALINQKCLSISYHAYHSQMKTTNRIVDPLGLVFYSNAWHLIAYCTLRKDMRDFRLDRIQQLTISDQQATRHKPGDLNDYFENYWENSDLLEVKVWFASEIVNMVIPSRYYFGFIDEEVGAEGCVMRFAVSSFEYLARWLLSFDSFVRVVSPDSLKEKMIEIVRNLADQYLVETKLKI